jgi:hypothetical protein
MGFLTTSARLYRRQSGVVRTLVFELVRMALQAVPGVGATVRHIQRAILTRNLQRLHDVLATTGFDGRYAVCGGMLLGWAREGGLLLDDALDVSR